VTERPADAVMRKLWGRMAALYGGARWASATSALPCNADGTLTLAASTWADVLRGIVPEQIAEGLRACVASRDEYVPTPMQFRARCLGIPSLAAVRLAIRNREATPMSAFVRLTWSMMDGYALRQADQRRAESMIVDAYDLASEHIMRGGPLPADPVATLEQQPESRTPPSDATVAASVAACAAALDEREVDAA
jgi:hypothetical protein